MPQTEQALPHVWVHLCLRQHQTQHKQRQGMDVDVLVASLGHGGLAPKSDCPWSHGTQLTSPSPLVSGCVGGGRGVGKGVLAGSPRRSADFFFDPYEVIPKGRGFMSIYVRRPLRFRNLRMPGIGIWWRTEEPTNFSLS